MNAPAPMRPKDLALALLVILVWGLNFAVIKIGLVGVPPLLLGAMRFALAAFPALLFFKPPKVPLRLYLAYGLTMSVGQFAFLFCAIHAGMPSGLSSLVVQAQSFFTMLLAAWLLRESWQANQMAGLLLAACGLVLIGSAYSPPGGSGSMPLVGFLLTLGAAFMWACGNIVSRKLSRYGPINQMAFVVWASVLAPIPYLVLSAIFEGPSAMAEALRNFSWSSFAVVAYIAWAATLFGYGWWTNLMSRYAANRVAPFSLLVPIVGLTAGWYLFDERLQLAHFVGGALLMLGLLLNVFGAPLVTRIRQFRWKP